MSTRDDLSKFGFKELPSEGRLKKAFAEIAMQHHPDKAGDPEVFGQYRKAYDRLLKQIRKPRPCFPCKGKGKVVEMDGFVPVTSVCKVCKGQGSRIPDERIEDLCDRLDELLGSNEAAKEVLEKTKERLRQFL